MGLLILSTVHASTVRTQQVRRRLLSGCLVEIVHSRFPLISVLLETAMKRNPLQTVKERQMHAADYSVQLTDRGSDALS